MENMESEISIPASCKSAKDVYKRQILNAVDPDFTILSLYKDEYKEKVKDLEKELQTRKDTFEKMTEPLVYVCDLSLIHI